MTSVERELDLVKTRLTSGDVTEAYLNLGALCNSVQTMMYRQVFPQKFCPPIASFKVKDIEEQLEQEGTEAKQRWHALQQKLKWDPKLHLNAIKHCKQVRNKHAHPDSKLTEQSLTKTIEMLKSEGHFREDWLSLKAVQELSTMWKTLRSKDNT